MRIVPELYSTCIIHIVLQNEPSGAYLFLFISLFSLFYIYTVALYELIII